MKVKVNISVIFFVFSLIHVFGQLPDSVNQVKFKLQRPKPSIKVLFSPADEIYLGANPLKIEGIDSTEQGNYQIKISRFWLSKWNNICYLSIGDGDYVEHGRGALTLKPNPTIEVYLCKISGKDTSVIEEKTLKIKNGAVRSAVQLGKEEITPAREDKNLLLKYKAFSFIPVEAKDYKSDFNISCFDLKIINKTYHANSNKLTDEMIDALKHSNSRFVSVDNVFISDSKGTSICLISKMKKFNPFW